MECILCKSNHSKLEYKIKRYNFYRCLGCSFVYVSPIPSNSELAQIYQEQEFYSEGFLRGLGQEIYRRLAVIEKFKRGGNLLDIGCAAGFFMAAARDRGWDTVGIELSKHTSEYASGKLNLKIINKPLEEANLPERSFDVITLWGVIEHVADPAFFMKKVVGLLKDDGLVCLATNNVDGWMGYLMRDKFPFITYPEHLWLFNIKTIQIFLEQASLKVIKIDTNDIVTPEKAFRGISKIILGRSYYRHIPFIINIFITVLTFISQPLIWCLGKLRMGSEIEIYARKI